MKVKKSTVRRATIYNQLSMLSNIAVGVLLIPFVLSSFGQEVLVLYIQLFAIKAVVEIFTSSMGGGIVRSMLDNGVNATMKLSMRLFHGYAALVITLFLLLSYLFLNANMWDVLFAAIFLGVSVAQQPFLQRLSALGYQHLPAIIRMIFNLALFGLILVFGLFFDSPSFQLIVFAAAGVSVLCYCLAVVFTLSTREEGGGGRSPSLREFMLGPFLGYAVFAGLLAVCFQIEILMLESFVGGAAFVLIIVAWKVPNISTQFIWRYSEVAGLEFKRARSKKVNALKSLEKVERNVAVMAIATSVGYFFFAKAGYSLWMGKEYADGLSFDMFFIFASGIFILSINRVYSAFLQLTGNVSVLAYEYFLIVLVKILVLYFLSSYYWMMSFCAWFLIEAICCIINRRLAYDEAGKEV